MSICASARCGRTQDEFEALVQELLPPGRLFSIDNPDRCFSQYWLAVADIFKELEDCLCCLYSSVMPCAPGYDPDCDVPQAMPVCKPVGFVEKKTIMQRYAEEVNFPLDCVELTQESLCEWVGGEGCRIGSIEWLRWLMEFIGLDVVLDFSPGGIPISCHEIGKDMLCPHGPQITISGCDIVEVRSPICGSTVKSLIECRRVCTKIEDLRLKYFPAGVEVIYA